MRIVHERVHVLSASNLVEVAIEMQDTFLQHDGALAILAGIRLDFIDSLKIFLANLLDNCQEDLEAINTIKSDSSKAGKVKEE